jgi:hypothetical protein
MYCTHCATHTLQTKQFAGAILSRQAAFIDKLVHQGMLSSIEADDMMQQVLLIDSAFY